jgi:hypothetical protein
VNGFGDNISQIQFPIAFDHTNGILDIGRTDTVSPTQEIQQFPEQPCDVLQFLLVANDLQITISGDDLHVEVLLDQPQVSIMLSKEFLGL